MIMAFTSTPTTHFPGYLSDATTITFALADLTYPDLDGTQQQLLTSTEAAADIREVVRAILMSFGYKLSQLADADKPTKMSLTLNTPTTTGLPSGSTNLQRRNGSFYFDEAIDPTYVGVADES